jgi:phenylalanyl-tRNA synthetase beta chain
MPVVTLNKKYLDKLLGFEIDAKTLEDQVSKMGFGIEKMDSKTVSLEITPNRPDLLDAVGFARAIKNFMHKSKKFVYAMEEEQQALDIYVGKGVKGVRPYISGLVAVGAKLEDADVENLINFEERFCETFGRKRNRIAIGMHNLDVIKAPLYYDTYDSGKFVPLNEKAEMSFDKIIKESDLGKAYGETIKKGANGYPVLKDEKGPIALIPITNSERTRVGKGTTNIFMDVTGTSEYLVNKTADIFAATFIDLGFMLKPVRVFYTKSRAVLMPQLKSEFMKMPLTKADEQLGVALGFNNVISLANKMGYEAALLGKKIRFSIPVYRTDILNEQDIIEDLAIAYGYDYIQNVEIMSSQQGTLEEGTYIARKVRDVVVGMGFSEVMNSYLTNEKINFSNMRRQLGKEHIKLKNPKASSISIIRTWLLPSLLSNLSVSVHDKMPQNIFELDNVFYIEESRPVEATHLGIVSADSKANFNSIKAVFEGLNRLFELGYTLQRYSHDSFIEGRCAKIMDKNTIVGFFGEVHPEVLNNFGIEEPTVALELELRRQPNQGN